MNYKSNSYISLKVFFGLFLFTLFTAQKCNNKNLKDGLTKYIPADHGMVAEFDVDRARSQEFNTVIESYINRFFPEGKDKSKALNGLAQSAQFLQSKDLDWMGSKMVVSLKGFDEIEVTRTKYDWKEEKQEVKQVEYAQKIPTPILSGVVQFVTSKKAKDLFNQFSPLPMDEYKKESYRDHNYLWVDSETLAKFDREMGQMIPQLSLAFFNDAMVFATSKSAMNEAIDAAMDGKSIADDKDFKKTMGSIYGNGIGSVYLEFDKYMELVTKIQQMEGGIGGMEKVLMDSMMNNMKTVTSMGANIGFEKDGMTMRGATYQNPDDIDETFIALTKKGARGNMKELKNFPKDSLVASHSGQSLNDISSIMKKAFGVMYMVPKDIQDAIELLDGGMSFSVVKAQDDDFFYKESKLPLTFNLSLGTEKKNVSKKSLELFQNYLNLMLNSFGAGDKVKFSGDKNGMQTLNIMGDDIMVINPTSDKLVFSSSALNSAGKGLEGNLLANDNFKSMLKSLSGKYKNYSFVDLESLVQVFAAHSKYDDLPVEARAAMNQFKFIGGGMKYKKNVANSEIKIQLK